MANAPRNAGRPSEAKRETKAEAKPEDTKPEVKPDENPNPLLTSQESRKDEVKADMKEEKSALARKADALEKAGGDPAKVAELRHQAPAVRTEARKSTAEQDLGSAPTVRDAEARAAEESAKAEQLDEAEVAKGKNPGRRMNATRDQ